MRGPRYWQAGHPERQGFNHWVSEGRRALASTEGAAAGATQVVQAEGYRPVRNGRTGFADSYDQRRRAAASAATEALSEASPQHARQDAEDIERDRQRRTFVASLGGAGDGKSRMVLQYAADADLGLRRSQCFSHAGGDGLRAALRALPADARLVLVGHSWGGDTVARVAADLGREGHRIAALVTVGPVGMFVFDDFLRRVRAVTDHWTNVRATDGGPLEPSNVVAAIGRPCGRAPEAWADRTIDAPFRHAAFAELLDHVDATRSSARWDVLGECGRAPPRCCCWLRGAAGRTFATYASTTHP